MYVDFTEFLPNLENRVKSTFPKIESHITNISRKITTHRLFPPWWTRLTWSLKTSFRGNLMWHFEHGVQASFCITLGWLTLIWATRCWASENSQLHAEHLTKKVDNTILIFWRRFGKKFRENLLEKLDQNFFGAGFDLDLNHIIV